MSWQGQKRHIRWGRSDVAAISREDLRDARQLNCSSVAVLASAPRMAIPIAWYVRGGLFLWCCLSVLERS
jgi:hypothetical protein